MPYKVNPTTGQLDYYEVSEGGGGGVATNLSFIPSPASGTVVSDSGTDADIPLADTTNSGLFSPIEKTKLEGIQAGAEVNVQSDWNATSGDALILNKPTELPTSFVKHSVKYGIAINKGQAAYVSSSDGTNMIVTKADYSMESTSSKTMGLIGETGALNHQGFIVTEGLLAGLDTTAAQLGDPVWLGDDGNLLYGLANKPVAPNHIVFLGIVTRVNANNGEIFVKVQNGYEIDELHNVLISSPVSGQILKLDTDNLWKNWTPNYISGSGTANYIAKFTGSGTIGINSLIYDNGSKIGVGITSPSALFHINNASNADSFLVEDASNPDSSPFVIDKDGNLGIGTTNPTSKLSVRSTAVPSAGESLAHFTVSDSTGTLSIQNAANSDGVFIPALVGNQGSGVNQTALNLTGYITPADDIGTNPIMTFRSALNSLTGATTRPLFDFRNWGTSVMTIAASGNVGIGITNPTAKLHITHTNESDAFKVEDSTNPDASPFVIDKDGNVGIGNTSPGGTAAKVTIQSSDTEGTVRIGGGNGAGNARLFLQSSATDAYIDMYGNSQYLPLRIDAGPLSLNSVAGSGNVGVGTSTPSTKLEVNGDLKVSTIANATTNTGKILVSDGGIVKYRTAAETISDILTITNTGTSGAATLVGDTLNIPNYASGSGEPSGSILSTTRSLPFKMATNVTTYRSASAVGSTTVSSTTFAGESTHYFPISLKEGSPVNAAAFRVNSAGSAGLGTAEIELGIYNSTTNANGELIPGTLEVQFGKVSVLTTGVKEAVLASPYTLGSTVDNIYWIAFRSYSTNSTSLNIYSSNDVLSSWVGISSSTSLVKLGMFVATTPYTAATGLPASLPATGGVGFTQSTTVAGYVSNQLLIGIR